MLAACAGVELGCRMVTVFLGSESQGICAWFLWCHDCMHQLCMTAAGGVDASMYREWEYVKCLLGME